MIKGCSLSYTVELLQFEADGTLRNSKYTKTIVTSKIVILSVLNRN